MSILGTLKRTVLPKPMQYSVDRYLYKRRNGLLGPRGLPHAAWHNAVLKCETEVARSMVQLRTLGSPPHNDTPKNWDGLAALDLILANTRRTARIFDAGGEHYSVIL